MCIRCPWGSPIRSGGAVQPVLAFLVTITNQSGGDLQINPADFVARDAQHRIYPANAAATIADAMASRSSDGVTTAASENGPTASRVYGTLAHAPVNRISITAISSQDVPVDRGPRLITALSG
jgi:hypothetical protein